MSHLGPWDNLYSNIIAISLFEHLRTLDGTKTMCCNERTTLPPILPKLGWRSVKHPNAFKGRQHYLISRAPGVG